MTLSYSPFVTDEEEQVRVAFSMFSQRIKASRSKGSQRAILLRPYHDDPVGFARDMINWREDEYLTSYQEEILSGLVEYKRESVRGPHGLGKSTMAAILSIWFAETREACEEDWKVITTASAWRQLRKFLWPEIHKWVRRLRWDRLGRVPYNHRTELQQLSLKMEFGEAFAVASDQPEYIEGAHADELLYIFDESKAISADTFDAAEGALAGKGNTYAFMISTPGEPIGRFYEIQSHKTGYEDWHVRHVRVNEVKEAGFITDKFIEQRRKQWGETSAVFANRILGEFAVSDVEGVIPLAWVERAQERWLELKDLSFEGIGPLDAVGADVADQGEDSTVLALRHSGVLRELRTYAKQDAMQVVAFICGPLNGAATFAAANGKKSNAGAVVDVIGVGSGVVARLRELNYKVAAFNSSEKSDRTDIAGELGFINKRAAAWWNLRELLNPDNGHELALPDDDMLLGDLTAPHWKVASTGGGRIQIESKDDLRKPERLGRSTDRGDAVVMAYWEDDFPKPAMVAIPFSFTRTSPWR